jgi:hypothetical protein
VDEVRLDGFLKGQLKLAPERQVLVLDTLSVARNYGDQMELSPINSGSTYYDARPRGLSTFTPFLKHDFARWQRLRAKVKKSRDHSAEVTVVIGVIDITDHLIERHLVSGAERRWISLPLRSSDPGRSI